MNNYTVVVSLPNIGKPAAWVAYKDLEIVVGAEVDHNMVYKEWTNESAIEVWPEITDMPHELLELLDKDEPIVEYGNECDTKYALKSDAPSELEYAKECIAENTKACHFLALKDAVGFDSGVSEAFNAEIAHLIKDLS